jgi:hypothetical protein
VEGEPVGEAGDRGAIFRTGRRGEKLGEGKRRETRRDEAQVGTGAGRDYCAAPGVWGTITPRAGRVVAGDGGSG